MGHPTEAMVFLIRRARIEDAGTLVKLAKLVHFMNLPADRDVIAEKILHTRGSFSAAAQSLDSPSDAPASAPARNGRQKIQGLAANRSDLFMFVLEEQDSETVIGTSQIITRMGGPGNPNLSFKLSKREFFSKSLKVGSTHLVAQLHLDESGPTELGGLIVHPAFRDHRERLGRFLSLIRFHFMGLFPGFFAPKVIAEMMAPLGPDGQNPLWEYFGRRFINLTYTEADRFCQTSREFMTSLLPREPIYLTLLPPEARAVVGQVNDETRPAKKMLESLGFKYRDCIDPFDGGPHLECETREISLVKSTRHATLGEPVAGPCAKFGFVSVIDADGEFRALQSPFSIDRDGALRLPHASLTAFNAAPGNLAGYTPTDFAPKPAQPAPAPTKDPKSKAARRPRGKGAV